jgi:hypothetical protein
MQLRRYLNVGTIVVRMARWPYSAQFTFGNRPANPSGIATTFLSA